MKFEIRKNRTGYFWTLIAKNGKPVLESDRFMSKRAAWASAQRIIEQASEATIVDLTG